MGARTLRFFFLFEIVERNEFVRIISFPNFDDNSIISRMLDARKRNASLNSSLSLAGNLRNPVRVSPVNVPRF